MKKIISFVIVSGILSSGAICGQPGKCCGVQQQNTQQCGLQKDTRQLVWDLDKLFAPPKTYPAPEWEANGVKAMFYEGLPYKGNPTRVFAWYGAPKGKKGEKFPAVVCVHGGGGTAFDEWVRIWNQHGYAAISMDLEGQLPNNKTKKGQQVRDQHQWHGPHRNGSFADINEPIKDQWMYHAIADVILVHSLIKSFPEVDSDKIGVNGISWGGIITSVVVGVDNRFKFAIPVYGTGYLFESQNMYQKSYEKMTPQNAAKCRMLWDGASYLPNAKMPMLWLNGTNDIHFFPSVFQKSYRAAQGPRTVCLKVRMKHGHGPGWDAGEVYAFADSVVKGGKALPKITGAGLAEKDAWVSFESDVPIEKAEFNYTTDSGIWDKRKWLTRNAKLDSKVQKVTAQIPETATAYYFNLIDQRGLVVSSEHIVINPE